MTSPIKPALLALALGLAVAGTAAAQSTPTPAQQQELDAARGALEQAAQRLAELHRKYGGADAPVRIEQRLLRRPVIGVLLAPDEASGVRIAGVTPGGAAAVAGLESGDRIVSIDGRPIAAPGASARVDELRERLSALDGKSAVRLGYERAGKTRVVALTPKTGDRLMVLEDPGRLADPARHVRIVERAHAAPGVAHQRAGAPHVRIVTAGDGHAADWAMVAPDVRTEIVRLGRDCKGDDCRLPVLAEALRWHGLNLASVDAQLGRYFGATEGVLVLSAGKELEGLQPGDVIRSIGGKRVASPREAMDALRAHPADGKVAVEYLRDRVAATAQVSVPKPLALGLPRVAAHPATPGTAQKRKYVVVDADGKRREWEGDAGETPPAWVQSLPRDGQRMEKRVQVTVDKDGRRSVTEGETSED